MSARSCSTSCGVWSVSATLPLLAAACWARFAPLGEEARFVSALLLVFPGWVASACVVNLVRRRRALLATCLILCAASSLCLWCGP